MDTLNEILDEMILNEIAHILDFEPDPERAKSCIIAARQKIAVKLICLLSDAGWKDVASNYKFPEGGK